MSYDISLVDPVTRTVLHAEHKHDLSGGTYAIGGTTELSLNVTYNYAQHFYRVLGEKGIRTIYGMTGQESIPVLGAAIAKLGGDTDPDYWQPAEGNARAALIDLLAMAHERPDGEWEGD
jgi:hypothetical protein